MSSNGAVQNAIDYYSYGKVIPACNAFATNYEGYRYQFTGHEKDGETSYQCHGARYMSVDRYAMKFFHQSPYVYAGNMPINAVDHNGDSVLFYSESGKYLGYSHDNQRYKDQNLLSIIADKQVKNFQEQYDLKRKAKYTSNIAKEANVAGLEAMGMTLNVTELTNFANDHNKKKLENGKLVDVDPNDSQGENEFGAFLTLGKNKVNGENNMSTLDPKTITEGTDMNVPIPTRPSNAVGWIHTHTSSSLSGYGFSSNDNEVNRGKAQAWQKRIIMGVANFDRTQKLTLTFSVFNGVGARSPEEVIRLSPGGSINLTRNSFKNAK